MNDLAGFDYVGHGPSAQSVYDFTVIRRDLTRQMIKLVPQMLDEIGTTLYEEIGKDQYEWKEVRVNSVIEKAVFRAANRIIVGIPLCRSKKYVAAMKHWTISLGACTAITRFLLPISLRDWLLPTLAIPAKVLQRRILSMLLPNVRQRVARFRVASTEAAQYKKGNITDTERVNDMTQWIIENNAAKDDPAEMLPENIAGKMTLMSLFAVNSTSAVASMCIIDLLTHHSSEELIRELQDEASETISRALADPKILQSMTKMDSAIRETLRFDPFMAQGMVREVMPPEGIVTPDGLHLPQKCRIHSVISSMQRDDVIWQDAGEYDPLRHYRAGLQSGKQRGAAQLDEHFLTFGLGRHACPGRFFAIHSIKLIIGYLLLNYDIKPSAKPQAKYREIMEAVVPAQKYAIRIRKRKSKA